MVLGSSPSLATISLIMCMALQSKAQPIHVSFVRLLNPELLLTKHCFINKIRSGRAQPRRAWLLRISAVPSALES